MDAESPRLNRLQWVVLLAAGAAYVAWCALYVWRTSFVSEGERVFCLWDDGMIAMHYARNFAHGDGLVWNAGETPVQGFTNLGVTLVMAAVHWLPLGNNTVALAFQVLNVVLLAGIAALVFCLARRLFPEHPSIAMAAAAATLLCAPIAIWSLQGSDAGFVAIWLLASLVVVSSPNRADTRWPWWVFVLLALGLVIRADAALLYVLICGGAVVSRAPRWRSFGWCAAVLLAVLGALVAVSWLYYGDPLPNTYYLKATGSPRGLVLRHGLHQLGGWLPWLAPALALATFAAVRWRRRRFVVTLWLIVGVSVAYCVWVGGDWAPQFGVRFFAPCLPLLAILAAAGLHPLCARALVDWRPQSRVWGLVGLAVAVTLLSNPSKASSEWFSTDGPTMYRKHNARNHARALYVRDHTASDTVVGVHWAGVPVYFSERPAVDVLGKSDRHIAKLRVRRFHPGHSKWDWDYVVNVRMPDVILITTRGLARRADFQRQYVEVVRDGTGSFFMRRESLTKLHDPLATIRELDSQ